MCALLPLSYFLWNRVSCHLTNNDSGPDPASGPGSLKPRRCVDSPRAARLAGLRGVQLVPGAPGPGLALQRLSPSGAGCCFSGPALERPVSRGSSLWIPVAFTQRFAKRSNCKELVFLKISTCVNVRALVTEHVALANGFAASSGTLPCETL